MKLVFLLPQEGSFPIGGFKIVYEYANRLAARGHDVTVVHVAHMYLAGAKRGISDRLRPFRWLGFALSGKWKPHQWFKFNPLVKLSWIPTLIEQFLPKADVYVATWWTTANRLASMIGLPGKKLYLIQHLETWLGSDKEVMATWTAPLEKIVIARWLADIARELGEQCHYIPNGLDFSRFGCDEPIENRIPTRVAMMFSHSLSWKGSYDGLAALAKVKEQYPDLQVETFGIEPRPDNLPDWVEYHRTPAQAALRRIYNRAAIFVAPSHSEGWGLPPCEAMMSGAAVVATDIGGHREFCSPDETALLVPVQDAESLANAIKTLMQDNSLRIRIADNGRQNIQRFTWDAAVSEFERVMKIEPDSGKK
ncbi:glycosyltransferase family 4 protein [Acidicapsa dinghuensis]|uniref:Glycosyltransferase family 4 protein n=1 Tax=Acidicapsa dinghuensis TaxID=2218256 RepID=A0ABW1EC80_9BACT|nr:glycosyltransferase family 4 protein [Acidicapsa dinghuensis]